MGKRLMLLLVFALLVGLVALPAFAEVQNVKVSGDITALGIARSGFHLGEANATSKQGEVDNESHAASIVRLRVDADLTENVGTSLRLINERDWGQEATGNTSGSTSVDLDLAYVTLKEFLYSPLTLTIGRQEIQFGNGFIVGDPDTNNMVTNTAASTATALNNDVDLSARKAFDALRATLNYDPLVVDLIMAKIDENNVLGLSSNNAASEKDDINLYGINARYDFGGAMKLIGELYYFGKETQRNTNATLKTSDTVNTIGGRVEISPIERLNLQGELAFQGGKVNNNATASGIVKKDAMGAQLIATYALDMKYKPVLTAVYTYASGDKDGTHTTTSDKGWDPMFENQTSGHIINVLFNQSDCQNINLRGSIVPIEDLTLTLDYVYLTLAQPLPTGTVQMTTYSQSHASVTNVVNGNDRNRHLGNEVDLTLNYDYTADVQLGLLAGIFLPGNVFVDEPNPASEVIASVKVSF